MGRHGDRAAGGSLRRGDGTAGGLVIPLVVAALVCLLATSGVWLLTADKDTDGRDDTPIGLKVPTSAPVLDDTAAPDPSAGKAMPPDQATSASPSPTPTPSKTTKKPATSAPPTSAAPPPSSTPPPPPPSSSAPPQPKAYAVAGSATRGHGGRTTLIIEVRNPNASPLGDWRIEIDTTDLWVAVPETRPPGIQFSNGSTVIESGGTAGQTTVTLKLRLYFESPPQNVTYTFKGARTTVPVTQS